MNEIIPVNQAFSNVKLIGLFFCSVWASPCKLIANELIELYNETNQGIKNLEIIQITLEKTFYLVTAIRMKMKESGKKEKTFLNLKFKIFLGYFINIIMKHVEILRKNST